MKNNPFLPALILGLAVVTLSALFPKVPAATGVRSAILELEFARSAGDVYRVTGFGMDGDGGPSLKIIQAIKSNTAHDRWFIFAYVLFLALSCAIVWKLTHSPVQLAGIALSISAGAFDFMENRQMLIILDQIGSDFSVALGRLHVFTWLKWGSIALAVLTIAPFAWKQGIAGKLLAMLSLLTILAGCAAAGVQQVTYYIAFSGAVMLSFVLLFLFEISYGWGMKKSSRIK